MALRLLLQLALLRLGTTRPLAQGRARTSAWPSLFHLNSPLGVQETMQIPNNGSAPLLVDVQVFVSNVFNVDILRYTMSSMLLLRLSLEALLVNIPLLVALLDHWRASTVPCPPLPFGTLSVGDGRLWVDWQDQSPRAQVDRGGHVELYLALTTETNCNFELLHFPRDQSDCTLSFYALSSTVTELEFQAHVANEIVSVKREYVVRGLKTQVPPQQLVPCFQVTLHLQNTAVKAIIALVVPGEALLLADVCGGLLPLWATERTAYKVTLLLGYLVFHSSLVQALPSSSSCNPLLIYYFTILLLLLFISTMETVLLAGLLARGHLGAKSSPSAAPRGEQRDRGHPGPHPEEAPRGVKGSWRTWAEAADHTFFRVYVAGVLCSQLIFVGLWVWATCASDPAPGEAAPHGGQPRL